MFFLYGKPHVHACVYIHLILAHIHTHAHCIFSSLYLMCYAKPVIDASWSVCIIGGSVSLYYVIPSVWFSPLMSVFSVLLMLYAYHMNSGAFVGLTWCIFLFEYSESLSCVCK